jgi:Domain of unknown function (DUF4412)
MKYLFGALLGAMALPVVALAQPVVEPTRDVVVTYHIMGDQVGGPDGPKIDTITIGYAAGGKRTWIEPGGSSMRMIADKAAGRMFVVMLDKHMYMEMPYDPHKAMTFSAENSKFSKTGSATIAGIGCTTYDVQGERENGSACLTSDGVLLKAVTKDPQHPHTLEATSVRYGAQPQAAFAPPDGFQKMDMSKLMGRQPGG